MTSRPLIGQTIRTFLVDGTTTGLRKITMNGWTGLLFTGTNENLGALVARPEMKHAGVCMFSGPSAWDSRKHVQVEAGDCLSETIEKTASRNETWNTVIAITTNDNHILGKHAQYLKWHLDYRCDKYPQFPEEKVRELQIFLSSLHVILDFIGYSRRKNGIRAITESRKIGGNHKAEDALFEIYHQDGVYAMAVEEQGKFVVLEGSEALHGTDNQKHHSVQKIREKLIQDNRCSMGSNPVEGLARQRPGVLRFARAHAFDTPSIASSLVLDRISNGRQDWKLKGTNICYHDWQLNRSKKKVRSAFDEIPDERPYEEESGSSLWHKDSYDDFDLHQRYRISRKDEILATMIEKNERFLVLEGSKALCTTQDKNRKIAKLKKKLMRKGVLVTHGIDRMRFTRPWAFNDISTASALILGRDSDGQTEWKRNYSGMTYRECKKIRNG